MSNKAPRLMVMAGGSGGHVFPGLAVAHYLQSQGWEIRWLGTRDRMEVTVPKHGIDIDFIEITGLRGKGVKALLTAPFRIAKAVKQAKKIMRDYQPDAVLGMGGFVSGPGGVAAWRCGIPVILHEQNGVAGLTNGWLSKIATTVLQGFLARSRRLRWSVTWCGRISSICRPWQNALPDVKGQSAFW